MIDSQLSIDPKWPPTFTLDQEKILNLLIGDRFYTNPSAALREAILNAIDAVHRRRKLVSELAPAIRVVFDLDQLTFEASDDGIGMSRDDVSSLFTKVGSSAAANEAKKDSVGEFGIGVISYFMAGDSFSLQTFDGEHERVGLSFSKAMLGGGSADQQEPTQRSQGTTLKIWLRDRGVFDLLLERFPHWCRDVEGLQARLLPDNREVVQGGTRHLNVVSVSQPHWVERVHLGPVSDPVAWDAMTGISTVAVLYRGVFVQEFSVEGIWGIQGSIDVDPKHFKPRLNRESFIDREFQAEVQGFLRECHPPILEALAERLASAVRGGILDKWTEKRWANLWLSVPRDGPYQNAAAAGT